MQGQNPFSAFLLVLMVVSWSGAQLLQRGLAAAQGRPGVFLLQRGAVLSGGKAEGTSFPESPLIPVQWSKDVAVERTKEQEAALQEMEEEELFREQARNAKYSFSSSVEDSLNDQMISRQETRDDGIVKGSYSYRDGYFERTVRYEADENGYRVVSDETIAIGDGPKPDPNGKAFVKSDFGNAQSEYAISADDLQKKDQTERSLEREGEIFSRIKNQ